MMLHFQEIFDIKLTRQEYRYQKSRDFSTYQKWIGFYEIIFLTIQLTSYVSCFMWTERLLYHFLEKYYEIFLQLHLLMFQFSC